MSTINCRHCGRTIIHDPKDGWINPDATGDDSIWREACEKHDTFTAEHEPELSQLEQALAAMERAIDAVKAEAEKLPEFPMPPPECCDFQTLRLIERGYTRCTSIDTEGEDLRAYTNGYDDYSEEGDFQWIKCVECGKRWKTPEGLDYV